ncbi:helix-turn-helix domain-containing protein [Kitasatospora phosalacinea]|uniref:HTH cro/C1-type domain-containing protein n=1 Tax=Kitasatospora phosalacinea TaxID=2065 RepID=A0A9W6PDN5_9ACTN|nr:helix-turn-helix transcriptional regulator [Kitasatospora phosalacinea]GLW53043.1 hypothetical protein Kpho01_10540 [Kitasatospora phosalacinea]
MSSGSGKAPSTLSVSDAVAMRVREARARRGWTTKQTAEACAAAGVKTLTAATLANIETGRRGPDGARRREISVDELAALAAVLDLSPMHLLGLPDNAEPGTKIRITPGLAFDDGALLLDWFRGQRPLPGTDARQFYSAALQRMPAEDGQKAIADLTRSVLEERAAQLAASVNSTMARVQEAIRAGATEEEIAALFQPGPADPK